MFRLVALLAITAAANVLDDETSLIQIQKALKPGSERDLATPQETSQELSSIGTSEVAFEAFMLGEEGGISATPAGCVDRGCLGSGPDCGGNDFDCTSIGLVATGYYKACSVTDTCQTGWKVRCGDCSGTPAPPALPPLAAVYPNPVPAPAYWQEPLVPVPVPAANPAPAPPVMPTTLGWRPTPALNQDVFTIDFKKAGNWGGTCLCPDGIVYGVGDSYDGCETFSATTNCLGGTIVGKCNKHGKDISALGGWSGGSVVCANPDTDTPLNLLIKAMNNATATHKAVDKNVTLFRRSAEAAGVKARRHRRNAVAFAKKVALSNVTISKATKAMTDAYFSQKGASDAAQASLADRKNADAQWRYYTKVLVDKKQASVDTAEALELAAASVAKAKSDLAIAKASQKQYGRMQKAENKRDTAIANAEVMRAKHAAVESSMESAYIDSSEGRNNSNVPRFGGGKLFHFGR